MIPSGLVRSIVAWALDGTDDEKAGKLGQIRAERDSLMGGLIGTGKGVKSLTSGTLGAKTFAWQIELTTMEKLEVLTSVLEQLGASAAPAGNLTYAEFGGIIR